MKKASFLILLGLLFGFGLKAQYFYFDTLESSYKQGCSATLSVKINSESYTLGFAGGGLWLRLHPSLYSYYSGGTAQQLVTALFNVNGSILPNWTQNDLTPSLTDNNTLLKLDRFSSVNVGKSDGPFLYGNLLFSPVYSGQEYQACFEMEYLEGYTSMTYLSNNGNSIIKPSSQLQQIKKYYPVLQQPCVSDSSNPTISVGYPNNGISKQTNLGISLNLTDNGGSSSNVPYVWTGENIWTGNVWGIDAQYGIDIATLQIILSGNGQIRTFNGGGYATPSGKTWQFLDKNYNVNIPVEMLFDYGIEKKIDFSLQVRDRKGLQRNVNYSFNNPQGPTLIAGTRFPAVGANFVNYDAPIRFGVEDEWAGVDFGSIVVTLSGINGTSYGPFQFSGSDLTLSGLSSFALQPNWFVEVSDHADFPGSGNIRVNVVVRDMEGNLGNISDYNFVVRPSCSQLGCCDDKYLYYKNNSLLFVRNNLNILGGKNPFLFVDENGTGYLNCGIVSQGLSLYRGSQLISISDSNSLRIAGSNVKAILSGSMLVLQKIFDHGSLNQGGGRGGGGSSLKKDSCPDGDFSKSYYDHSCGSLDDVHDVAKSCPVENSPYTQELTEAFEFAYGIGVTTMCPIERADIKGNMLRKHLAKMISEYAIVIVGLYPDITKKGCDFYDDIENESSEMKFYSKISCQLGLMGLESDGFTPQSNFRPNDIVTRAQFGTILSRLIFGETYNVSGSDSLYYANHLSALKNNGIMTKIEYPEMNEMRGWVMLMLQRTFESGIIDRYRLLHNAKNSIRILYDF